MFTYYGLCVFLCMFFAIAICFHRIKKVERAKKSILINSNSFFLGIVSYSPQ